MLSKQSGKPFQHPLLVSTVLSDDFAGQIIYYLRTTLPFFQTSRLMD